ncbi:MAG: HD domain-containing protein [Bacillota bacterium]
MHPLLFDIRKRIGSVNNINECSVILLHDYGKRIVAEHSKQVAAEAKRLAMIYDEDTDKAELAGILHDISAVIPNDIKIEIAENLHLDILPEEREFPLIIHQKLSKEISRLLFGVKDESVISAISCHTTN